VIDLSAETVRAPRSFGERATDARQATRNQRLASIHALARFIGAHSPQHVEWCAQSDGADQEGVANSITIWEKPEIDALLAAPDQSVSPGRGDNALLLCLYNSRCARQARQRRSGFGDIDGHARSVARRTRAGKERRCRFGRIPSRSVAASLANAPKTRPCS